MGARAVTWGLWILLGSCVPHIGSEVCYRKHQLRKGSSVCRGLIHREFVNAQQCCAAKNAVAFAPEKMTLERSKRKYHCTPCSTLKGNDLTSFTWGKGWTSWSEWGECSQSCGAGVQKRIRICQGGKCRGPTVEKRPCQVRHLCPVPGAWGPWYGWAECSASCGEGTRVRSRKCNDPAPQHGGAPCKGRSLSTRKCRTPCPVDGGWGEWSKFSPRCSKSCGGGVRKRHRSCNNPRPKHGGRDCSGRNRESIACNTAPCPVDGGWSLWTTWTTCSATCGEGLRTRRRSCDSPRPQHGGQKCEGDKEEMQTCTSIRIFCPVDGLWASWSGWSGCDAKICSSFPGHRYRTRACAAPPPQYGGKACTGTGSQRETCYSNVGDCSIDGGWCGWQPWGACGNYMGKMVKVRRRKCQCPAPFKAGEYCKGLSYEDRICDEHNPEGSGQQQPGCHGDGSGSGSPTDGSDVGCDQEEDDAEERPADDGESSGVHSGDGATPWIQQQ